PVVSPRSSPPRIRRRANRHPIHICAPYHCSAPHRELLCCRVTASRSRIRFRAFSRRAARACELSASHKRTRRICFKPTSSSTPSSASPSTPSAFLWRRCSRFEQASKSLDSGLNSAIFLQLSPLHPSQPPQILVYYRTVIRSRRRARPGNVRFQFVHEEEG